MRLSQIEQLMQLCEKEFIRSHRYFPQHGIPTSPCFKRHLDLNSGPTRQLDMFSLMDKVMQDSEAWTLDSLLMGIQRDFARVPEEDKETQARLTRMVMAYAIGAERDLTNSRETL